MLLTIWTVVFLFGIAVVIDHLLTEENVDVWRRSTRGLRTTIHEMDGDAAIRTTHGLFCDLFDAIYGSHYWSKRRFFRSYYSSLLALSTVTLLLGWDTTVFNRLVEVVGTEQLVGMVWGMSIAVLIMNPCVDYLSLQETRWILGRHTNPSPRMLALLVVVDLAATSLIFLIGFTMLGFPYALITNENFNLAAWWNQNEGLVVLVSTLITSAEDFNYCALLKRDEGLVVFASTFFTSALWLGYMTMAVVIRVVKRYSRVFVIVLDTIGESNAPARTFAGLISVVLVAGYGATQLGIWVSQKL